MTGAAPKPHPSQAATGLPVTLLGDGSGVPLMLLHGFLGDARDWMGGWGNRPVAALDLPGHGRALRRDDADYSLAGAAAACAASAGALGWDRYVVVGYSMGGRVAMHLALADPRRVAGLVAVSAHPGIEHAEERAERLAIDRERARRLVADPEAFLGEWYTQPLFATLRPEVAQRLVRRRLEGDPAEAARALVGLSTGCQPTLGERLRDLGVPALLVSGRLDERYDRLLARLASSAPNLVHVSIEGAGHAVHLERPDELIGTTISFIERNVHVLH